MKFEYKGETTMRFRKEGPWNTGEVPKVKLDVEALTDETGGEE